MARECIGYCPNIRSFVDAANSSRTSSALLHVPVGGENTDGILWWCEASYDCDGPEQTTVEVKKGLFRKRLEKEVQFVCKYPEQEQPEDQS